MEGTRHRGSGYEELDWKELKGHWEEGETDTRQHKSQGLSNNKISKKMYKNEKTIQVIICT